MLRLLALGGLAVLLVSACGGDDDDIDAGPRFDPAMADELAHAAIPGEVDLPGSGWEITATDDFGDDDDNDDEFMEFAAEEDACRQISDLAALGNIMGADDDSSEDEPVGHAKTEFQRPAGPLDIPSSVEVEIEIEETVADIQGGWGIVRSILGSDDTSECFAALMSTVMARESEGLFEVTLDAIDPPAAAPHDGVALAFRMEIEVTGITLEAVMGLYMWPYSNAGIQVMIIGSEEDLGPDAFKDILAAVDASVRAAGE